VYSVIFTQAARVELVEAQDWYEGEATGLADVSVKRLTPWLSGWAIIPGSFLPSLEMFDVPSCAAFRTRCFLSSKMTP
jgi:hypothetical protein